MCTKLADLTEWVQDEKLRKYFAVDFKISLKSRGNLGQLSENKSAFQYDAYRLLQWLSRGGGCLPRGGYQPPTLNRMTDGYKNITFLQLLLRTVINVFYMKIIKRVISVHIFFSKLTPHSEYWQEW